MARAMWKGAIQFGLVTIPVKLYLATESKAGVSFNMLHASDLSRIQMKIYCPEDEQVISRSDTVKGYEYAPGQYVVVTDDDLEKLPLKTVRAIEIEQFVEREQAAEHVRFVKQSYYLEPDKIGRKAFSLLKAVLADKGLSAICKVVIKDREALAALDPFADTMILSTLYWPDEIRSVGELDLPAGEPEVKPVERLMAEQLVGAMTREFDPAEYRDEYRDALNRIIEAKVEGRETVAAPAPESGKLVDLMAALEASVAEARRAREASAPISVTQARADRVARTQSSAKAVAEASAPVVPTAPRPARATHSALASRAATPSAPAPAPLAAQDEAEVAARPARRRKTA